MHPRGSGFCHPTGRFGHSQARFRYGWGCECNTSPRWMRGRGMAVILIPDFGGELIQRFPWCRRGTLAQLKLLKPRMAQSSRAATERREAFGVRGACSRFRATRALRQRQAALLLIRICQMADGCRRRCEKLRRSAMFIEHEPRNTIQAPSGAACLRFNAWPRRCFWHPYPCRS